MLWKDSYWNGVIYILFSLLIGWGSIMGFQKIGHGLQNVFRVQTSVDSVGEPCSEPQAVATMAAPVAETETSQAVQANNTQTKQAVHAKDIIKGKATTQNQKQTNLPKDAQSQQVQQNLQAGKATDTEHRATFASFVERAGIGLGIFVKKETRNAVDGLVQLIEQGHVQ